MRVSSHSKPWRSLLDLGSWDDSGVDTPPAVRRVLQLWQGFRLDDYAAFHRRPEPRPKPRSASCARSPKVTIPKPFSLVQREVEREAARGTRRRRLAEELAQLALERRQREEAECAVRVRAAPVPARSLLPLYHELRERAQRRSLDNRAARKEELRASLKPFEFAEREENKREEERVRPRHNLEKEVPSKSRRAGSAERPALRAVLDPSVSERLAADELLRRVRAGMRAQELLEKAAIPPGLHAHIAEQARGRSRTAPMATRCSEPSFRPRVHHSVPDFQRLLRDFQRSSLFRSAPPPPAACAPFALRTTERGEKRAAAATASAGRDERPRAFRSSPCPAAADWIPTRSNDAARRRHGSIRSRALEGRERKERDEEERAKTRREREKAMRADLLRRARANDPHRSLAESHPGKLRQIKEQDKKRTHEYSTELQAMKDRVARRPLLLEQVTQRNAKRQAERRYREALRETGMDEEFVRELGSGAAGGETAGPADEDGNDDDDDDGVDGASDTGMTGGVPDSGGQGDSQASRPLQNSRDDKSEDVKESQESDEGDFEDHREEGDKEDASEGEDDADERQ